MKRLEWEKQLAKNTVSHNTTSRQIKLSYGKLDINWISRYETMSRWDTDICSLGKSETEKGADKSFFPQNWQLMCRAWNVKNAMLLPHFWLFWHFLTICLKLVLQCIGITKRVLGWKKLRIQQAFVVEHHKIFVHCLRQHNHDFNWIFIKHSRRFRIVLLKIALSTYVLLTK